MDRRIQTTCLVVLTSIAVAFALRWLRPAMIPFVLALFATLGLQAVVAFLVERLRVPQRLALPVTLVGGAAAFGLLATLVSASIGQLTKNASVYNQHLAQILADLVSRVPVELLGFVAEADLAKLSSVPLGAARTLLAGTTNAVLEIFSQSVLVAVFVVFLMIGAGRREPPTGTWREIELRVERYLVVKAAVSALTGLLVGALLAALGIPLALVFGLFAFLLNFIPSIGSLIATLLPLPVILVSPEVGRVAAVLAIALPGAVQFVVGSLLEPKIMGESLDLHPVVILLMLIFWGMLWGIPGMLLATPISAVIKILFEKPALTRPIAELMAGRLDVFRSPGDAARV